MKFSKSGFTLMELLVYMAIVGIIVVIAGEAFSNSTKFRVRTDNMIKSTQEAENVGMLFKADVEQMGTKSSKELGNAVGGAAYGDAFSAVHDMVYMDPTNPDVKKKDYSSFLISTDGNDFSNLVFRRMRYDEDGHYTAIEEINWFVENGSLMRSCKLLEKKTGLVVGEEDPCGDVGNAAKTVEMATQVTKFKVIPATPGAMEDKVQVFPSEGNTFRIVSRPSDDEFARFKITNSAGEENNGGTAAVLTEFYSNYDNSEEKIRDPLNRRSNQGFAIKDEATTETNWKTLCSNYGRLTLVDSFEYEISFDVQFPSGDADRSLLFVPGVDHMAVGFRNIATGRIPKKGDTEIKLIDDFLFFPPVGAAGAGKRTMRFHVPEKVDNVCLAFTFASYSPLVAQGRVTIRNLKLNKVAGSDYKFGNPPFDAEANKSEKKNVKALKMELQVSRGAKNGGHGETGEVSIVVPVPSNGLLD